YPTLAKASVYINHHEPIFTDKGFKLDHLKSMLNTLKNNSQWSVEELKKEAGFRRQHLFFLELKKGLDEGENYLDNIPDRLGKYHRKALPPPPTEDDGFGVRQAYEDAIRLRKNQAEYFNTESWTEEDRWNYWKIGDKPLGTMLWYFNRVIYGSDKWNKKFQESNHNNELFLSKLFYEKTLTKDQRQYWDMDFIM
ncbi:hypothetical protein, partial [Ureaplasma diversum]|uniref:hypothetical protein n=1 Tax=Ureaplasma diversum TaxID=42094 RepID=UPI000570FAF8